LCSGGLQDFSDLSPHREWERYADTMPEKNSSFMTFCEELCDQISGDILTGE
jgi:hypothetical protein